MINARKHKIPKVSFRIYHPNKNPKWLIKKKQMLENKWRQNRYDKRLISKIMKKYQ